MSKMDPLEELMRSRLLDDKPADSGWNVPPDSVFDDAMNAIDADKKNRRKPFFFILLASALIIAISLLTYRLNQRITHLNTEFNELKSQTIDNDIKTSNDLAENAHSGNLSTDKATANNGSTNYFSSQPSYSKNTSTNNYTKTSRNANTVVKSPSITNNLNSRSKLIPLNTPEKNDLFKANSAIIDPNNESIGLGETTLNKTNQNLVINLLTTRQFSIISDLQLISYPEEMDELLHPINLPMKESNPSPISIFGFAGANISSLYMKNMSEANFSLTGYEKYCVGYQFGIGSEYDFNDKWTLNSSISYARAQNHSKYESDYKYDQSNEYTNDQGEVIYQDNIVIESPMHPMTEAVNFKTNSSGPGQDDMMKTKASFKSILHFANLDIGLDYTIYESDKTKVTSGLGIRGQYLVKMKEDMDMQIYHDSDMMMEKTASHSALDHMNRALISPFGKIGFNYKLNDRNAIKLTGNYYHPLTSIRQSENELNPSTYLKNIEFSILFKHSLK